MTGVRAISYATPLGPTCGLTGKTIYATRKDARRRARRAHPGEHLTAYQCGGHWHFGHLPQAAMAGIKSRTEVYR